MGARSIARSQPTSAYLQAKNCADTAARDGAAPRVSHLPQHDALAAQGSLSRALLLGARRPLSKGSTNVSGGGAASELAGQQPIRTCREANLRSRSAAAAAVLPRAASSPPSGAVADAAATVRSPNSSRHECTRASGAADALSHSAAVGLYFRAGLNRALIDSRKAAPLPAGPVAGEGGAAMACEFRKYASDAARTWLPVTCRAQRQVQRDKPKGDSQLYSPNLAVLEHLLDEELHCGKDADVIAALQLVRLQRRGAAHRS